MSLVLGNLPDCTGEHSTDSATSPSVVGLRVECTSYLSGFRYKGWLAGYQSAFDVTKSQLTSNNFAVGLDGGDFTLNAAV